MFSNRNIAFFQATMIILFSFGIWYTSSLDTEATASETDIFVTDSNGITHSFESPPSRVAITNTYAATVLRMLDVNLSVVSGVSGDFYDEAIWPEFSETPMIQQSAHSEIDFEALLDVNPDVYIVFATNGMVDTNAIREKLEPVGIVVLGLDFFKYDSLRSEINALATLFEKQSEADLLFEEFDSIESDVHSRISTLNSSQIPKVVMEHHASLTRDPVVLTGTSQWTDLIDKAGGDNVFKDLPGHTTHVDMEAILDVNPDVLMFDGITFELGFNNFDESNKCQTHMEFISQRPGFDEVQAVMDQRMLILSGEFAGPMMIFGLPTLAKYLHPDLFSDIDSESYLDDYFEKYHDQTKIGTFTCTFEGA
ncbi:MAG: ABC transporter substrate-binding protein [Candidatus Poseidoniaceae archaeon]|nr:ABC transporter substrate-binding protein [Candidatus Poseidoniaceae archaeon]|tara:strand:+ start:3336 stop:4433 length:1098 start_codon:yes stop_codon:yes gene_type:complete